MAQGSTPAKRQRKIQRSNEHRLCDIFVGKVYAQVAGYKARAMMLQRIRIGCAAVPCTLLLNGGSLSRSNFRAKEPKTLRQKSGANNEHGNHKQPSKKLKIAKPQKS